MYFSGALVFDLKTLDKSRNSECLFKNQLYNYTLDFPNDKSSLNPKNAKGRRGGGFGVVNVLLPLV